MRNYKTNFTEVDEISVWTQTKKKTMRKGVLVPLSMLCLVSCSMISHAIWLALLFLICSYVWVSYFVPSHHCYWQIYVSVFVMFGIFSFNFLFWHKYIILLYSRLFCLFRIDWQNLNTWCLNEEITFFLICSFSSFNLIWLHFIPFHFNFIGSYLCISMSSKRNRKFSA